MDTDRFDAFVRALGRSAARRSMVAGFLGGGLTSVLATLESEARRANRHKGSEELSAEKRKKHKRRKKKNRPGPVSGPAPLPPPPGGDQAPPCTEASCPLPPGCSAQVFDDCTNALFEALLADVEPCQSDCDDPDSPACQACLEPIVTALVPEAEACTGETCTSPTPAATARHRAQEPSGAAVASGWWTRTCDKPTCCYTSLRACEEDVSEELFLCLAGAVLAAATTGPGAFPVLAGCMARLVYNMSKCRARNGCPTGSTCGEGDVCCPYGATPCAGGCCDQGLFCCAGDYQCCIDISCDTSVAGCLQVSP